MSNPHISDWIKCFNSMSHRNDPNTMFRDWARCFALSIANSCVPTDCELWKTREAQYLEVIHRYQADEIKLFPELCGHLTMAFERETFADHLGSLYMSLFGGNKNLGQCFTPMSMCQDCAKLAVEPVDGEERTCGDECCGGGAMLIAACEVYRDAGVDYHRWLKLYAGDLDALCVHMCYIQLSLIGARAEVWHRDAMTRKEYDHFVTPMEALGPAMRLSMALEGA